uniref:Reverse transcriptase domain-containing protein n=1 Tax=Triticum urartu TaxID=4572 RepID=A0A8R7R7J4_TRIUA
MTKRKVMNWNLLQHPSADLQHLETQFNEDEIKAAVFYLHDEKAPGPDGFIGKFFKRFWDFIREDLVAAVQQLYFLRGDNWKLLNSAHIVLLPKVTASIHASDYRPVSLLHSFAKIFCKLLANRLGPELQRLISCTQSAFIRGRSIQDNFLYVKNTIRDAHKRKIPLVFLKLDFAKAFDTVSWPYLIDVMKAYGFGQRWGDIISLLLASSTSRVLLNGSPGPAFAHRKGLRQGDPLSPMLFILAMDP